MRRLSTAFLVAFIALFLGLGGVVAWKVTTRRAPAPPAPAHEADYRVKEIHMSETLEGNLRWTLDADQAEVFDDRRRTVMRQVTIRLFSDGAVWTVTASKGILDNDRRDVSLGGDVVVASSDGLRMTSDQLHWRNEERLLFTEEDVEISRAGTTITGAGLRVQMNEQHAVVDKGVRVIITNRNNANLALFPRSGS